MPDSNQLERPCFTASGVWRGSVEIAPIAAFVIPFGIAFGVAASAQGISPEVSVFMSIAIYAGASQFAVLDLWYAPLPLATLALTVFAVNARHILLGAALAPWLLQVVDAVGAISAVVLLAVFTRCFVVVQRAINRARAHQPRSGSKREPAGPTGGFHL
jgi:predicted branched-subunit amino acid permease